MNQDTQNILDKMATLSYDERAIWTNAIRDLIIRHTELSAAYSHYWETREIYKSGSGAVSDEEMNRVQNYLDNLEKVYSDFFLSMPQELQNLMNNQQEIYLDLLIAQQAE